MNSRHLNLLLYMTAAALLAAAVAAPFVGLWIPADSVVVERPLKPSGTTTAVPTGVVPSTESFEPVVSRTFRKAVDSPATEQVAIVAKPEAASTIGGLQLVGTVGESVAMIKGPDGTVALAEVGDDVNGAVVETIRPSRVELRQNGKLIVLQKAPPDVDNSGVVIR